MNRNQIIIKKVLNELAKAEQKFPGFPIDPLHASSIIVEELGELQQACLKWTYEGGYIEPVAVEALHTAAMALRFLFNIKFMKCNPSQQKYSKRLRKKNEH